MKKQFIIARTEQVHVPFTPIVNMFIAFVRANNYPQMCIDELVFEGAPSALCSTLDVNNSAVYDCAESGRFEGEKANKFLERDECFNRFDGGWVLQNDRQFHVCVDNHLYFFDF